ncbi:hypothetical protein N9Z08_02155, partial [Pirellulales bacterium]|nr:hypothetical protein [Pirellulales bacterium]
MPRLFGPLLWAEKSHNNNSPIRNLSIMRFPFLRLNKSQPIRRSDKSQPIRKKLSQSDALISEVLERRQMLAADMTLYDVEFETMPANLSKLDANSYSLGW